MKMSSDCSSPGLISLTVTPRDEVVSSSVGGQVAHVYGHEIDKPALVSLRRIE